MALKCPECKEVITHLSNEMVMTQKSSLLPNGIRCDIEVDMTSDAYSCPKCKKILFMKSESAKEFLNPGFAEVSMQRKSAPGFRTANTAKI